MTEVFILEFIKKVQRSLQALIIRNRVEKIFIHVLQISVPQCLSLEDKCQTKHSFCNAQDTPNNGPGTSAWKERTHNQLQLSCQFYLHALWFISVHLRFLRHVKTSCGTVHRPWPTYTVEIISYHEYITLNWVNWPRSNWGLYGDHRMKVLMYDCYAIWPACGLLKMLWILVHVQVYDAMAKQLICQLFHRLSNSFIHHFKLLKV